MTSLCDLWHSGDNQEWAGYTIDTLGEAPCCAPIQVCWAAWPTLHNYRRGEFRINLTLAN